jgi:hypothetical protein
MSYGVTVIGLVSGSHIIEDIRVTVPYQVAVQIAPELAHRSRDLTKDIQDKKVLQVRGALPAGAVLRGHGAVPRPAAPLSVPRKVVTEADLSEMQELRSQNARLHLELSQALERETQLKQRETQLQTLNLGLQTTLTSMSGQLQAIQGLLEELKKQGVQVAAMPGLAGGFTSLGENDAPLFIPESFKKDDAKVNIQVKGETTDSAGISESRSALRNLRKGQKS